MNAYSSLAPYYDLFMRDVNYEEWADYYEEIFETHGKKVRSVLDLACGTGTLSCILAERGYDVVATDASAEMLSVATAKRKQYENPLFINQSMEKLDLYGTVEAAICSLDGMNYVNPSLLPKVFERVSLFLEDDGLFIFDINTENKFKAMDKQVYINETESVFCTWRSDFKGAENLFVIDIFSRNGKTWLRKTEEHTEYVYSPENMTELLQAKGFEEIRKYAQLEFCEPSSETERIFISAKRRKTDKK